MLEKTEGTIKKHRQQNEDKLLLEKKMFKDLLNFPLLGPLITRSPPHGDYSFCTNLNLLFPRIPAKFGGFIWFSSLAQFVKKVTD